MAILAKDLREAILQAAIQGKLTERLEEDGNASDLLIGIEFDGSRSKDGRRVKQKVIEEVQEEEIDFDIPDSWEWVRLGKVCLIARGGSPRPIKSYITTSKDGLNWIRIGDTDIDGKYISSTSQKIRPEGLKKSRLIHPGDFLLTNSMSFGRPYISKIEGCIHDGWLVISQQRQVFNTDYLYLLLSSIFAYEQFSNLTSGAVVQNLNSEKVANSLFPLPPLAEQERIVVRVEELMAKITEYEKIENHLLELQKKFPGEMRDALLQAAMQGKLTEQLAEDGIVNTKLIKIKENNLMEECEYEIPETWKLGILESITDSVASKKYQIKESEVLRQGLYPVISQSSEPSIGFSNAIDKLYKCEKPIIVFGDHTCVLKIIDFDFVVGADGTKLFIPNDAVKPRYLFYAMMFITRDLSLKGGYTRHYKYIKNTPIPIPPITEQERIIEKLDQLLPLCESLKMNSRMN